MAPLRSSLAETALESKLDNAQAAGAVAAVIYDNVANEALVLMGVGQATLPAEMISNSDGLSFSRRLLECPPPRSNFMRRHT